MKNEVGLKGWKKTAELQSFQTLKIGENFSIRSFLGTLVRLVWQIHDTKFYTVIKHSYDTGNISLKTPEDGKNASKS